MSEKRLGFAASLYIFPDLAANLCESSIIDPMFALENHVRLSNAPEK